MPAILQVEHITTYKYAKPVTFGEHRAMFLPTGNFAGRILDYSLETNLPSQTIWIADTLGNNVAFVAFSEPAAELIFTCRFRLASYGSKGIEDFPLRPRAERIPVQYTPDEWIDLAPFLRPHADDPDGSVAAWAKSFTINDQDDTRLVLQQMMDTIRDTFTYQAREAEGTQSPGQTLATKTGTCRDYAWLMIEALRRLGFACRFVTGYLYDKSLDGGEDGMVGSGATHAWLLVYLPGAGWLNYDPTNRITEGFDLIRVATVRHPGQAMPLTGSWTGVIQDYLGMTVTVEVRKLSAIPNL
jgi:transglutaminase-like putative cysteine protease